VKTYQPRKKRKREAATRAHETDKPQGAAPCQKPKNAKEKNSPKKKKSFFMSQFQPFNRLTAISSHNLSQPTVGTASFRRFLTWKHSPKGGNRLCSSVVPCLVVFLDQILLRPFPSKLPLLPTGRLTDAPTPLQHVSGRSAENWGIGTALTGHTVCGSRQDSSPHRPPLANQTHQFETSTRARHGFASLANRPRTTSRPIHPSFLAAARRLLPRT